MTNRTELEAAVCPEDATRRQLMRCRDGQRDVVSSFLCVTTPEGEVTAAGEDRGEAKGKRSEGVDDVRAERLLSARVRSVSRRLCFERLSTIYVMPAAKRTV